MSSKFKSPGPVRMEDALIQGALQPQQNEYFVNIQQADGSLQKYPVSVGQVMMLAQMATALQAIANILVSQWQSQAQASEAEAEATGSPPASDGPQDEPDSPIEAASPQ